ncbi:HK97-gp10 family putative phage morphogenesis protein [Pukyongiella litopenaei]|uniref:HK97 gp10 family phage protein n=1 Tax=Pukyongiella litopenaei TaxID=2605946 RepID=A0A2S0ML46_9RHOB|nr:HK97-gp10 family putative phage morphogenesis protein [Pukyongiella litopenaei]AVO36599.1 HK97 gp10 family phage protein [Pukyongiella litopenaei]
MVQGLDKLNRRWKAIPKNARINVRYAMEEAANDIVEEMWSRAPYRTGEVAESIGWTWGDAPAGTMTIGKVRGREYGTMRITIYAGGGNAFYAKFHEFGTVNMPAHPFFFPVWRARSKRVKGRVSRAISQAIKKG